MRAAQLGQQLRLFVLTQPLQIVNIAQQPQPVGFELDQLLLVCVQRAGLRGAGGTACAQRFIQLIELQEGGDQAGARLRQAPGLLKGVHRLFDGAGDRPGGGVRRDRVAQLIEARGAPHVVDDVLHAHAALGIEAALLSEGLLARAAVLGGDHAREYESRALQPGLGFLCLFADGLLFSLRFLDRSFGARADFLLFAFDAGRGSRCGRRSRDDRRGGMRLGPDGGGFRADGGGSGFGRLLDEDDAEAAQIHHQLHGRAVRQDHFDQGVLGQLVGGQIFAYDESALFAALGPLVYAFERALMPESDQSGAGLCEQAVLVYIYDLGHAQRLYGCDDVGIYDIGVAVSVFAVVVLVRADFVVFAGMLSQVNSAVAAQRPHAGFEVAQFVFVGYDADEAVFQIVLVYVFRRMVAVFILGKQGSDAKIEFLRVVLLQKADRELSGQSHTFIHSL